MIHIIIFLNWVSIRARKLLGLNILHLTLDLVQALGLCTMLKILPWGIFKKTLHNCSINVDCFQLLWGRSIDHLGVCVRQQQHLRLGQALSVDEVKVCGPCKSLSDRLGQEAWEEIPHRWTLVEWGPDQVLSKLREGSQVEAIKNDVTHIWPFSPSHVLFLFF